MKNCLLEAANIMSQFLPKQYSIHQCNLFLGLLVFEKHISREAEKKTDAAHGVSCLMHSTILLGSWKMNFFLFLTS
jgi:hypothetical protein